MSRPLVRPAWLIGAGVAVLVDRALGEPPTPIHPVACFGRAMTALERSLYRDSRWMGVVHATLGTGAGLVTGLLVRSTVVANYVAVGGRSLAEAASAVARSLDLDLERARSLLPTLVGRDPSDLDAPEVARAVIESVAENTVDAIVAPTVWAAALGPAGALGYRAVNTMDAMVGHHSTRFENYGWASARLDDVVNWIPARLTAALVALVRPRSVTTIVRGVRTQAPLHPSPNAGVSEVAFAAALGLRLGGRNRYDDRVEIRPPLGYGRTGTGDDIDDAIRLSRDVSLALAALLVGTGVAVAVARA